MSFWRLLCCENQTPEPARRSQKVFVAYKEGGKYEGEHSNHKRNGYGVFTYPNQDQYDGEWLNDKRHGRGKMLFSNGDFYMGEWVNDSKEGRGLHVSHEMWKYQGEWKSGEIDGLGKLVQVDGSFYEGEFKAGKRDGKGIFYNSQNKKKYINVYKAGELQKCELLLSAEKQNSPGGHSQRDLASGIPAIERMKVTEQDIKLYEACNPELKDVNFDQLISYIQISKVREMHFIKIHPSQWKSDHINSWLKVIGLADYQETFAKSKVSGSVMMQLSEEQLKQDLKMKLGDRKKFMKAVTTLKNLHQPKKQKRVLKHLKPFKKAAPMPQGMQVSSATRKPQNSNRYVDIKTDAIVEEIGENEDHDDSPGNQMEHSHRRKQSHTRRVQKDQQVQQNRDYHTYVWRTYNTLNVVNRDDDHRYDSLNIQQRDLDSHADLKSHQFGQKIQQQHHEDETKQNEAIQTLALVPIMMNKKQTSKRVQKKKEEDEIFEPHLKKDQSKKGKEQREKEDDAEGKEDMKRVEEEDTETSSEESDTEEKVPNKRKRSRDERSMQMRQLYEFLKEHHISMNFLIPQNQLTHMQEIGEGGYGKVYKAKYMSDRVAVKTYVKSGRIHRKSLNDFLKQVQILNDLRHPNVVLYMGMCVQISRYSLVTEYLEQGSLFDQLHKKQTKLSTQKIYQIVEDIVLGMVYLHAKGILHRDLKSSNVLIADDWKVKLCDFGLSVIHNNKKKKKVNSQRIGTYQWMAPEVLRREQDKIGFPADVYSFGMILWELLAHQIPFKDYTVAQIEGLVAYDQTFNVQAPPHSDPLLQSIMKKCLQKDPSKRPTFLNILDMLKQGTSMSDIL